MTTPLPPARRPQRLPPTMVEDLESLKKRYRDELPGLLGISAETLANAIGGDRLRYATRRAILLGINRLHDREAPWTRITWGSLLEDADA